MTGIYKKAETGYGGHFDIIVLLERQDKDGHFGLT